MARAAESSQLVGNCALEIGRLSVWPSMRSTQVMSGGISAASSLTALASFASSVGALGIDDGLAGVEQHFGLEDEAVADDADVGAALEDFAQAAEEVGAVAAQVLRRAGRGRR